MNLEINILIIISLLGWKCDQLVAISSKGIIGDTVCDDSTTEICKTLDLNAFCDLTGTKGTCACERGMVEISEKCEVIIGGYCNSTRPCVESQSAPSRSECSPSSQCNCIPIYVHSVDNTKCLNIINDLRTTECLESQQCQKGKPGILSECIGNSQQLVKHCQCTDNATETPGSITSICQLKASLVGDVCISDSQCTPNLRHSHCIERKCQCITNLAIPSVDKKRCLLKVYLEDLCTDPDPAQCNHIANASCSPNPISTCQCNSGYIHRKEDKSTCFLKATSVGGKCDQDDIQCEGIIKSSCNPTKKTCDCDNGYVPNGIKNKCVQAKPLNQICEETAQCTIKNSECRKANDAAVYKTCECTKDTFVQVQPTNGADECVEIRTEANMECKYNAQCTAGLGELSACRDDVCQCRYNYGYYNHSCYIPAGLGEICSISTECYVGVNEWAYCATGAGGLKRCQCLPGTKPFDSVCYRNKVIGNSCKSDKECSFSIAGEVFCNSKSYKCECKVNYTPADDKSSCVTANIPDDSASLSIHTKHIFPTLAILILSVQLRWFINV